MTIPSHYGPMNHPFDPFLDEDEIIEEARSHLLPRGPVVQVFRYHPGAARKRRREYVGTVPAEEFDLSYIQSLFGGGEYHFQFRDSRGRYRGSGTASIAGVIRARPS